VHQDKILVPMKNCMVFKPDAKTTKEEFKLLGLYQLKSIVSIELDAATYTYKDEEYANKMKGAMALLASWEHILNQIRNTFLPAILQASEIIKIGKVALSGQGTRRH
jgi:hypothetical protein